MKNQSAKAYLAISQRVAVFGRNLEAMAAAAAEIGGHVEVTTDWKEWEVVI